MIRRGRVMRRVVYRIVYSMWGNAGSKVDLARRTWKYIPDGSPKRQRYAINNPFRSYHGIPTISISSIPLV